MEHTGFPSDETLAAFIDGRLDPETRGKVIAHMATCSECYSVFIGATEMTATAAPPAALPRSTRNAWLAVAVATVAAAVAIVFLVTPVRDLVLPNSGMAVLAKAAPPQRTIVGRISGFPYQPMAPVARGESYDPMKDPSNAKLLTAAAGVQRSATARRSVANLHALGVTNLLLGNDDAAIDTMREALLDETSERSVSAAIAESNDVPLLNDLSVALSHRAVLHKNVADAAEAARCAERAWNIGRTQEAAWNRAVAMEALNGPKRAGIAWQDYLALDSSSPWAAEARKKLTPAN